MKKLKPALASLAIGLLGSIIFEFLLKDLLLKAASLFSLFLKNFMDSSFYAYLPSGGNSAQSQSYVYLVTFFIVMLLLPPKYLRNLLHVAPSSKKNSIFYTAFQLACAFILFFNMLLDISIQGEAAHMLRKIEIIAPYINEIDYAYLKSDFYQISTKEDYDALNLRIEEIADKNGLEIQ